MACEFSDKLGGMNNDGVLNALDASAILKWIIAAEAIKITMGVQRCVPIISLSYNYRQQKHLKESNYYGILC